MDLGVCLLLMVSAIGKGCIYLNFKYKSGETSSVQAGLQCR